jgi:putative polyhydroxyalkanoate system protein
MADIDLERTHALGTDGAKDAVRRVAQQMEERLSLQCHWEGNTLQFSGNGADGQIDVDDDRVHVAMDLNLMLRPMKDWIRSEAESMLDEHLAPAS